MPPPPPPSVTSPNPPASAPLFTLLFIPKPGSKHCLLAAYDGADLPTPQKRNANVTGIVHPYAWLTMEIAQLTDSLEEITEIEPLEIAEIFGNVGGFWGEFYLCCRYIILGVTMIYYVLCEYRARHVQHTMRYLLRLICPFGLTVNVIVVVPPPPPFALPPPPVNRSFAHQICSSCCGRYSSSQRLDRTRTSRPATSRSLWPGVRSGSIASALSRTP